MINTVMQTTAFRFQVVPAKKSHSTRFARRRKSPTVSAAAEVVRRNLAAIDRTLDNLFEVAVPELPSTQRSRPDIVPKTALDFVQRVTALMLAGHGDYLPVSAFPGRRNVANWALRFDRRSLAKEMPTWDSRVCIQCNKCVLICPHAAIRSTVCDEKQLGDARQRALSSSITKNATRCGAKYRLQVAPDDCTGCGLCVQFVRPKTRPIRATKRSTCRRQNRSNPSSARRLRFSKLPAPDRKTVHLDVKRQSVFCRCSSFRGPVRAAVRRRI